MEFYAIALRTKLKNPRVTVPDKDVSAISKKTKNGVKYFARASYMYKGKAYQLYKIINEATYKKLK